MRRVVLLPKADEDLKSILTFIGEHSPTGAKAFFQEFRTFCTNLAIFPERGQIRDESVAGLRTVPFRKRATIAFLIEPDRLVVLRILYRGRDVTAELTQGS